MTMWRIRTTVDDRPGCLAALTTSLARLDVNILSLHVHPTPDGAVDELVVEAAPLVGIGVLLDAVRAGGGRDTRILPGDPHGLADAPTHTLRLAARLGADPGALPDVLSELLGGADVRRSPAAEGSAGGDSGSVLHLPDPHAGTLAVSRPSVPFTPAEYARAHAMVELAAGLATRPESPMWTVGVAGGARLTVRPAAPADAPAVVALHARCSDTALRRRYPGGPPAEHRIAGLLSPRAGYSLLAHGWRGVAVAMANLMWDGPDAELALLIAGPWQRRGLGTVLTRRLAGVAADAGAARVYARVHPDNLGMLRVMERLGRPLRREHVDGALELSVAVSSRHVATAVGRSR